MISWVVLYHRISRQSHLGWDLLTPWRAEKLFVHGGRPYSVSAFVYPPSSLVLLVPLAWLDSHQLTIGGLVATAVLACVAGLIALRAIGVKVLGPIAATAILLLSLASDMRGEMPLENVSVLEFLAFALFLLFAIRGRWTAAAIVIGLAIGLKPLLLAVLIVFVLARKWKALAVAVGIPVFLNALAIVFVSSPGQVLSKLPSLFDRTGSGVVYNSAWVDVARLLGLPEGVSVLLRGVTVAMVVAVTWLALDADFGREAADHRLVECPAHRGLPGRHSLRVPLHADPGATLPDGPDRDLPGSFRARTCRDAVGHGRLRSTTVVAGVDRQRQGHGVQSHRDGARADLVHHHPRPPTVGP